MHKTNIFRLLIFSVLIVLCSVGFSVRCFCASADETEQAMESPGTEDERTVNSAFIPGVYKIRNVAAYLSGRPCYLSDDSWNAKLSAASSGREQLWMITPTGNYGKYRIIPLSQTTLDKSGTDFGLFADNDECNILIDELSNGHTYFTGSEWGIYSSGSHYHIVSSTSFETDRRILGRAGAFSSSVDLYYDEDIYDIENWVEWDMIRQSFVNITESDLRGFPELLSVFQTDNIDLKKYLSVRENVTDQRLVFRMNTTSCAQLNSKGYLNVTNGNDIFTNSTAYSNRWITIEALNDETVFKEVEVSFKKINGSFMMWDHWGIPISNRSDEFCSMTKCLTPHFNPITLSLEMPYDIDSQAFEITYNASMNRYTIQYLSTYLKANTYNNTVELTNTVDSYCYWSLEDVFVDPLSGVNYYASFYFPLDAYSKVRKYLYIDIDLSNPNVAAEDHPVAVMLDTYKNYLFLTPTDEQDEYELQIQFLAVPLTGEEATDKDVDDNFRSVSLSSVMYYLEQLGPFTLNAKNTQFNDNLNNKNDILTALDCGRFVIFRGHGKRGKICLESESDSTVTLSANEIFSAFENHDGQLTNLDLLIFGSCESALDESDDDDESNLVEVCSDLGAKVVVGFLDTVEMEKVNDWLAAFMPLYVEYIQSSGQINSLNDLLFNRLNSDLNTVMKVLEQIESED